MHIEQSFKHLAYDPSAIHTDEKVTNRHPTTSCCSSGGVHGQDGMRLDSSRIARRAAQWPKAHFVFMPDKTSAAGDKRCAYPSPQNPSIIPTPTSESPGEAWGEMLLILERNAACSSADSACICFISSFVLGDKFGEVPPSGVVGPRGCKQFITLFTDSSTPGHTAEQHQTLTPTERSNGNNRHFCLERLSPAASYTTSSYASVRQPVSNTSTRMSLNTT
jgi:hypothetical protein